jgi:lipopolysaccharide biosynthesis glycosyltransferase
MKDSTQQTEGGPLVVVFSADDRFAMPLGVAIYSLLVNLDPARGISLYVLDGGLGEGNRRRLEALAARARADGRLKWITPDLAQVRGLRTMHHVTEAAYLRLLIPGVLPEACGKAIYLDCDLVVEGDLSRLWDLPLDGHAVLAAPSPGIPCLSHTRGVGAYRALGLPPEAPYFMSGLMVMDLKRWRAEQVGERALDYVRRYPGLLHHHDQEGLNAVLVGRWGRLDARWNLTPHFFRFADVPESDYKRETAAMLEEIRRRPYVIHFGTSAKPWKENCWHPARGRFVHYLRESGWFSPAGLARWHLAWWIRHQRWRVEKQMEKRAAPRSPSGPSGPGR